MACRIEEHALLVVALVIGGEDEVGDKTDMSRTSPGRRFDVPVRIAAAMTRMCPRPHSIEAAVRARALAKRGSPA